MTFSFTVSLQQHSPLIHFQHHQQGACLRATELKPKLDSFIIKKHFKGEFDLYKKYLVEYQEKNEPKDKEKREKFREEIHKALDYKVTSTAELNFTNRHKMIADDKIAVNLKNIKLKIFSFHPELLKIIKASLKPFFILTNFGTRQSKGFGCFTTQDTTQKDFEQIALQELGYIYKKRPRTKEIDEISEEYKVLKSGKNHGGYTKSKLFDYMCNHQHIRWEKRLIKETLKNTHPDVFNSLMYDKKADHNRIAHCPKPVENEDYRYIRALLGLAEHNEYRTFSHNNLRLKKIQITIKDPQKEIDRFQSPLQFKVFKPYIYIFPQKIPAIMFDRAFEFELENHFSNRPKTTTHLFNLKTPESKNFDMKSFLDSSLDKDWQRIP